MATINQTMSVSLAKYLGVYNTGTIIKLYQNLRDSGYIPGVDRLWRLIE